ncbi:thioredoxin fold domain-containing protein [Catenovulum maritimum]|nr:thioredoxin fold domain-containing protein [Catenovulum maritimum]
MNFNIGHFLKLTLVGLFMFCLSKTFAVPSQTLTVKPIPDSIEQQAFLLNGWRADRPNLLIFKDPFCPYCIKAIPRLDKLVGYNIYLFWAPILGNASKQRTYEFFHCERPVSEAILTSVAQRKKPECDGELQQDLVNQNNYYVSMYQINSVPSFYLQGQPVSLARLLKYQQSKSVSVMGVKPDWQRFVKLQQLPAWQAQSLLLLVAKQDVKQAGELVAKYQPEYLVTEIEVLQQHPELLGCKDNTGKCFNQKIKSYQQQKELFMLMFGDKLNFKQSLVFEHTGNFFSL